VNSIGEMGVAGLVEVFRPTRAVVDLDALTENVRALIVATQTKHYCAVVKADGYGHGAVEVARAAVAGGASHLAVALVEEGITLRRGGLTVPILVLSEPPIGSETAIAVHGLTATVYSEITIDRLSAAGGMNGTVVPVHLKVDTGMRRVGCQPDEAVALVKRIVSAPNLLHTGTFTHLAVADAPDRVETNEQIRKFTLVVDALRSAGIDVGIVHVANSAGAIAHPNARFDMVRCGIAVYGHDPDSSLSAAEHGVKLRPVMSLVSEVSHVKHLSAGDRVSYGLAGGVDVDSVVATIPIGYADGLSRRWSSVGGEVLIGGRRRRIIGRITMDQIVVDCGPVSDPLSEVRRGDVVVLIGNQGDETISAWEMATKLDTISYEITCAVSARVPRTYVMTENDGPIS
jgi:alanine racemase